MIWIVIIIAIFTILEIKFSPRVDIVEIEPNYYKVLLYYSIKSKYERVIGRDYITLIKFKK